MRKTMLLVFSLTFLVIFLFGCQLNESNKIISEENNPKQQTEVAVEKLKFAGEIKNVSISETKGSNKIVLEDSSSIEMVKTIVSSGIKIDGIADMANPEFYMDVIYEDGATQNFHLWIGENGETSTFMNTEDTHTAYTVPKEMTEKLIELIK